MPVAPGRIQMKARGGAAPGTGSGRTGVPWTRARSPTRFVTSTG